MGLTTYALTRLAPYLKPGAKVLCLGYQDIVATGKDIEKIYGYRPSKFIPQKWHPVSHDLPDTEEFFERLGIHWVCVDIVKARGAEVIADLNHDPTIPELSAKQYDLVIDGGTLEHCFNVGQAMLTAAHAVKVGGAIFHYNPLSMVNHGFWGFNPTLYHDFYTQNGWEVKFIDVCSNQGERPQQVQPVPRTRRFQVGSELSVTAIAIRQTDGALKFPVQSKYLNNPMLA